MRFLITGGAGFIGSALVRRLLVEGHEVHIMDLEQKIKQNEIKVHGAIIHSCSVIDENSFTKLKGTFDGAFHLAAQTFARISEESPYLDIDTNVKGTLNFCRWAKKEKPRKCFFTSSMAVYGSTGDNIVEDAPLLPVSVYGVTKCAGEHFFRNLKNDGIEISVFRLFNVYGPGQDFFNMKQGMLSIYLTQALTSQQIEVTGSLERYRDFIYIDDVIDAFMLCLASPTPFVINIGSGKPTLVKDLLQRIIKAVEPIRTGITVKQVESHQGDVWGNYANIDRAKSIGWLPKTTMDEGLHTTILDAMEVLGCK